MQADTVVHSYFLLVSFGRVVEWFSGFFKGTGSDASFGGST